jgi:hypothetical protein
MELRLCESWRPLRELDCLPESRTSRGVLAFAPSDPRQANRRHVLSLKEWEEKMAKQSNDDPQDNNRREPATSKEKTARLKEMEKLGTRGMLLGIMQKLGDEHVSDDQLRRALIILEGLEPGENPAVKPIPSL